MHQKPFCGSPDPLGELRALTRPLAGLRGWAPGKGRGKGGRKGVGLRREGFCPD